MLIVIIYANLKLLNNNNIVSGNNVFCDNKFANIYQKKQILFYFCVMPELKFEFNLSL